MDESEVQLYVYEVTKGLAQTLSPMILGGKQINGIWHTGVVVYGKEFYFGSLGIQSCEMGDFLLGRPDNIVSLGRTQIPYEVFMEHLDELGSTTFRGSCYHLFNHNCNTFSNEIANFLTGNSIPSEITDLPKEVLDTPLGSMLRQFLEAWDNPMSSVFGTQPVSSTRNGNSTAGEQTVRHEAVPSKSNTVTSAENSNGVGTSHDGQSQRHRNTPSVITYADNAVLTAYKDKHDMLRGVLRPNEFQCIEEVFEYLSLQPLDWSLHRTHLNILCNLMLDVEMKIEVRLISGLLLQLAVCRADFVNVCIHDTTNSFQNLIKHSEDFPPELLLIIARSLCNFLAENKSFEWLFALQNDSERPNTVLGLCTLCLLNENEDLRDVGCCIASNLLQNGKVPDDIALQIGIALIEVVCSKGYPEKSEDHIWFSLCECISINNQLVDLARTMGLDIKTKEEEYPAIRKHTSAIQDLFL